MKSIWEDRDTKKIEKKEAKSLFEKLYSQPIYVQPELELFERDFAPVFYYAEKKSLTKKTNTDSNILIVTPKNKTINDITT